MSNQVKISLVLLAIVAVISACTVIVQVQKDTTNSTLENSSSTNTSADSASVDLKIKP